MENKNRKKEYISIKKLSMICLIVLLFLSGCSNLEKDKNTVEIPKGMYTSKQIELEGTSPKKIASDNKHIYLLVSESQGSRTRADKIFVMKAGSDKKEIIELADIPTGEILCFQKMEKGYRILIKENTRISIIALDEKGNIGEMLEVDLKGEDVVFFGTVFDQDGGIYLSDYDGNLYYIGKDGILDKKIKTDMGVYPDTMFIAKDNKLFCTHFCADNTQFISWFDIEEFAKLPEGKEIKQKKAVMPYSSIKGNYYLVPCMEGTYDFYIYNVLDLYGYSTEKEVQETIVNWANSDINGIHIEQVVESDEYFFIIVRDGDEENSPLFCYELYKTTEKEYKSREILTVGTLNSYSLGQEILKYNKKQSKSRLIMKDYNNREDPYQALHNDIISGQTPDILDTSGLNIENYIKKGIVQDLTDFIKKDPDISEEDFLDNIVEISKVDGKLYYMPSTFSIDIWAGSNDIFQNKKTWTFKEFMEIYKGRKKGTALFAFDKKENVFDFLCKAMLDQFVNKKTGEVNFKTEMFTDILEFSKNYKESETNDIFKVMEEMKNGKVLLEHDNFYDFSFYFHSNAIFGEAAFIGMPSEHGTGLNAMISSPLLVITASSQKKDLAFEFLKSFWTYDYQKAKIKYSFSSRKDALAMKFEHASANKAYTDQDGEFVPAVNEMTNTNGVNARIMPLTEEEISRFQEIVESVDAIWFENSVEMDLCNMIEEEAQSYFQGDKNAKQVEEIIQSRVKLYMSENGYE